MSERTMIAVCHAGDISVTQMVRRLIESSEHPNVHIECLSLTPANKIQAKGRLAREPMPVKIAELFPGCKDS